MSQQHYYAANEEHTTELERMNLLQQIYDPTTIRHIEGLGISVGWKCLEVGAGNGSVAVWMSGRVGPHGKVVATDINTRFLTGIRKPHLEARSHNIVGDEIEEEYYDLVHCRCLLMHLNQFQKALGQMAKATRPGGWLLIEEQDWTAAGPNDQNHPRVVQFTKNRAHLREGLTQKTTINTDFGRNVRSLVEGLGFLDIGFEGVTPTYRGGELFARWYLMSRRAADRSLGLDEDIVERLAENDKTVFNDPAMYFTAPTLFSAWGRKP